MLGTEVICNEVSEIRFGLYSDEEIRALSICKIESPVTFDTLGNPLSGGLYDDLMGPQYQHSPSCKTCGEPYMHCPGHPGRIELCVPVYHPLLFKSLVFLLRAKCANCNKLRLSEFKTRVYLVKMKLIEMGNAEAVESLDAMLIPSTLFATSDTDIDRELSAYEAQYDVFLSTHRDRSVDMHTTNKLNELIEQFKKAALSQKRCENCKSYSPSLRKDGFTKIFEKPLSKKLLKSMESGKKASNSALELMRVGTSAAVDSDNDGGCPANDSDSNVDSDDEGVTGGKGKKAEEGAGLVDKYLTPIEVEARTKLLWASQREVLDFIFLRALLRRKQLQTPIISQTDKKSSEFGEGWKLFFLTVLLVPPNRFRPPADMGDMKVEHPQNLSLNKVLVHNEKIMLLKRVSGTDIVDIGGDTSATSGAGGINLSKIVSTWIELQNAVNCYMDSAKDPNPLGNSAAPPGIRQLMERKEGLFRKNMMGKRVNFCCRSVLSPDPFIGSNEIGIPMMFAKSLHYPTPVTAFNVKLMRQLVENGPHVYPGANAIEYPGGKVISLDRATQQQRDGHAKLLLSTPGIKVHRHLVDGDPLLVNRQPTLHKPGIMAHRARVLQHVKEQTIRMHYANCSSYNADFDGDEINCHFVQSELARAEANFICNNDNQYIVPTSGNPLRGLIQDHIASGVKLTCRDTFLNREEFQQLLYVAVSGLPGTEIAPPSAQLVIPPPSIMKPVQRWTGKQVISALINHMCRPPLPPLHLDGKTRTPTHAFGAASQEHIVVFRFGELLCGVLDKAAVGSSSMGIIHAVHELYGPDLTGRLLTAFGRVFTYFLQAFSGITCGISDLTLRPEVDVERKQLLNRVLAESRLGLLSFLRHQASGKDENQSEMLKAADVTPEEEKESKKLLGAMLLSDLKLNKVRVDAAMQGVVNKAAGDVIKACLPNGLESPFLRNNFALIVSSGAKGSTVNQSQISCFLGQQALEGQRVPLMISGKSLPSFGAFDGTARSGGFISDRFLTGVKPQEYYFHCMAGREGLIDTAVKTSRSGYLQRCLVKHLEELKVNYDSTVRDSDGNVIQFIYGEDGLDPTGASMLAGTSNQLHFLARNYQALLCKFGVHGEFLNQGLDIALAEDYWTKMARAEKLASCVENGTGISLLHKNREKDKKYKSEKKFAISNDLSEKISKKSVILARRKITACLGWSRNNMKHRWEVAEVVKVRAAESGTPSRKCTTYDLRYSDGHVEKKVPMYMKLHRLDQKAVSSKNRAQDMDIELGKDVSEGDEMLIPIRTLTGSAEVIVPLIRAGLPDPAMSVLPLDRSLGAMSEKMHKSIIDYVKSSDNCLGDVVTPAALEVLVGVKYMRALACPGEAVGCVAAQSIGEPSTQMTLNTFHLAGHGAANVTLGIPRMREIIMTASKTLKTPTMLLPLVSSYAMSDAKLLARKLSKLSLNELLHHRKGVEVGESVARDAGSGLVSRRYRIKLHFESAPAIEKHFGVSFDVIVGCVSKKLMAVLSMLIGAELRKNGEKKAAGSAISKYQERSNKGGGGGSDEDGEGGQDNDASDVKPSTKGAEAFGVDDISGDEESEQGDDGNSESGLKSNKVGKAKAGADAVEYEEEDEAEGENHQVHVPKSVSKKVESDDSDTEDSAPFEKKVAATTPGINNKSFLSPKKIIKSVAAVTGDDGVSYSVQHAFVEFELRYPAAMRRLLMLRLVEDATEKTAVRVTKGISRAYAVPCANEKGVADAGVGLMTEGVNFGAAWSLSEELCRHKDIRSNDINAILMTYGVEAARESIVSEIKGVFGVYGIDVNFRHLGLIADFMTRSGGYTPMNRAGMWSCPSPLQQMSFETTCTFLTQAAQDGTSDSLESPSARIVAGGAPRVGTGCFDVMMPLQVPVGEVC